MRWSNKLRCAAARNECDLFESWAAGDTRGDVQLNADGIVLVLAHALVAVRRTKRQVKGHGVRPFQKDDVPAPLGTGGEDLPDIPPISGTVRRECVDHFLRLFFC